MDNVILKAIFIGIFIIVIGLFIYLLYDYGTFKEDMKKENDAEEKLIKLVQKNYEYYHNLNNTLSNAVNENSRLTVSLQISDSDTKKRIQEIEKLRTQTLKSFHDNVVQYGEYITFLKKNNKELNKSIRFANVCATAKKIKKQTTGMETILNLIEEQTLQIWNILEDINKSNHIIDYRVKVVDYKIRQHEAVMKHLMDNNLIIAQSVEEFRQYIESHKQFVEQLINTVARFDGIITDMDYVANVNQQNINKLNTSNLADENDIIFMNNEIDFINNYLIELDERASNLELQISTPEWENIDLEDLDQRASNLRNTIQGYFTRVEELSTEQVGFVNSVSEYKTRMDTNELNATALEGHALNASNVLLDYRKQLNDLNSDLSELRNKTLDIQQDISQLENEWQYTSNEVYYNKSSHISQDIFDLDTAIRQYFNFHDSYNNFYTLHDDEYNYNVPKVEVLSTMKSPNGLTVHTTGNSKNAENFKICDQNMNCMQLSINNNAFYLSPDSIGNFSIMSGETSLADFDMNRNMISLGKHEAGINNDLGRPMVIKDGLVHMDGFDVMNCDPEPAPVAPSPVVAPIIVYQPETNCVKQVCVSGAIYYILLNNGNLYTLEQTEPIKTNVKKIAEAASGLGYVAILTNDKKMFYHNTSPASHNHREQTGHGEWKDTQLSDIDDISTWNMNRSGDSIVYYLTNNKIFYQGNDNNSVPFTKQISVPENIIIDKLEDNFAITNEGDVYEIQPSHEKPMEKIELNSEKIQSVQVTHISQSEVFFITNEGDVYATGTQSWSDGSDGLLKKWFGIEKDTYNAGYNTETNQFYSIPVKIDFFDKNVSKITSARVFGNVMFLTKNGDVYSGGFNGFGELGVQVTDLYNSEKNDTNHQPITKMSYLKNISHMALGFNSIFITNNGNIYTCGWDSDGSGNSGNLKRELGITSSSIHNNGDSESVKSSPVPRLIDNYEQWKTIINCGKPTKKHIRAITTTAGSECTFLLISDDTESIVLGVGKISGFIPGFANNNEKTFKKMTGLPSVIRIDDISTRQQNLLFVKNDGSVYGAGQNANYQLGLGQNISRNYFVSSSIQPRVLQVATGNDYSLFLKYDGTVFITGGSMSIRYIKNPASTTDIHLKDEQYQQNIREEQKFPVLINGIGNIVQISSGPTHAAFLTVNGKVYHSHIGQLEFPSFLPAINNQGEVIDASEIVQVSCGKLFTLFLKIDGTVQSLGYNSHGQLGDGTTTSRTSLVNISGLSDIEQVSAGLSHSAFLKKDGTVFACGNNNKGQLGDGTTTNKLTPTNVQDIYDVKQVTCGTAHTVFVTKSDQVFACGANNVGQLGDNTYVDKLKPVNVFNIDDLSNY
jgi:alpha-tubulin suppressor-like RCC1 family protein